MKLWIISDLHLRTRDAQHLLVPGAIPEADVCVLAGDVCDSMSVALHWVGKVIRPRMPVVFVPGNHEFYGSSIPVGRHSARMIASALGITLLDDASKVIDGVRFVGGTLWTDYLLFGDRQSAMRVAAMGLSDHTQIDVDEVKGGVIPRAFAPRDALKLHETTRAFLDQELARPHPGPTVVVTHHAPHRSSVAAKWSRDEITPAFVSDLSSTIERHRPGLWVHGHVHDRFDYRAGETRVICNPRGYTREADGWNWSLTVKIGNDRS